MTHGQSHEGRPGPAGRLRARLAALSPWARLALGSAAAAVLVAALAIAGVVVLSGDGEASPPLVAGDVAISPAGQDIPRLSPVVVTFAAKPRTDDPAQLVSIEPPVDGTFSWSDEQTLVFEPALPGFSRGQAYAVRVNGAAAGLVDDFTSDFTVEGRLTVDVVIPGDGDADVPAAAQIYVQFTRSVAPLTVLQEPVTADVIEFSPALAGTGEWLNTSLYRFVPSELKPSTTYTARIAAGLTTLDDGVLEDDFAWTFSTERPTLARSEPADGSLFVPRASVVVLTFNQAMDHASVEAGTGLLAGDVPVEATPTWSDDSTTLTLTPARPLEVSTEYQVHINAGLRGALGGVTADARTVMFRTSDPPRLESSSPANGATNAGRYGIDLTFNNPIDIDSLDAGLRITGIDPEDWQLYSWDERTVSISVAFKPSTQYTVSASGVVDREGLAVQPFSVSFTTGRIEPYVSFVVPGQYTTYAAGADQLLAYRVTNRDSVGLALYRLTDAEADARLTEPYLPQNWRPSSEAIRTWTEQIDAAPNAVALRFTSLGERFPLPKGTYFVEAVGQQGGAAMVFSVVDVALVTKIAERELLVWAVDYETGAPVANVAVQAIGPGLGSGSTGQTQTTDGDGLASFAVPSQRDVVNKARVYAIRVSANGRFGVTRTDWQNGSQPWEIGVPLDYFPRQYVAHLYTDRPIYRPGETVYYKVIARVDRDATYSVPPEGTSPLRIVAYDAVGEQILDEPLTTNAFGTATGSIELPREASVGFYQVSVTEANAQRWWVGDTSFQVAEFRRPEFQVSVKPDESDYVNGERIDVTADATFFFGGGVSGAKVSWTALGFPKFVYFPEYDRYSFSDFDAYDQNVFDEPARGSGETTTDADGRATFSVPASLRAGEGTMTFDFSVTVLDTSGQAVASSASVTVHPASAYVGLRPQQYVTRVGDQAAVDIVTVDTEGNPAPGRPVTVEVYRREWVTTKQETDGGGRHYVSEPVDTLLDTFGATTDGAGEATVHHVPAEAGTLRFVARVTDATGRTAQAATYVWVSGRDSVAWEVRNDDVLELIADRDEYEVGDVAQVLAPAPFEGMRALVTIERGGIIERSVRTLPTNSEVLRIPVESNYVPNVYVGVVLYRPPTDEDPLPRYKVGYVELPVATTSRTLSVTLTPDRPQAQPGETVTYTIDVTDARGNPVEAELSVAMVDAAVLSLASVRQSTGLQAFWSQRGLGVQTASSLSVSVDRANDSIAEASLGGKGGGGEGEGVRADLQNAAYWEGQLRTDASGRATVKIALPDNLTTWRTLVRAVSADTLVGDAEDDLLVTQPLLLRPALPRFLRTGDSASLRTLVRNATQTVRQVELTVEATGVVLSETGTRQVTVAPGESLAVAWEATVSVPGEARITFRAVSGELSDAVATTLPVYLDVTPETTATGGVVTATSAVESVYLPSYAITDSGSLDIRVQSSLVGALAEELDELSPRPYDSIVRVASRVIGTIGARRAEGATGSALVAGLDGDLRTLLATQRVDGGWGWCSQCPSQPAVTGWVLMALGEAHEAGALNPVERAVSQAAFYLQQYLDRPTDVDRPADPNERAFLLYSLQRGGGATWVLNSMRAVYEQDRAQLTPWGRAYLILGLIEAGQPLDDPAVRALVNDLSASTVASATGNHWEAEPIYGSVETNVSMTALVLRALLAADDTHPLLDETARWLVEARSARRWQSPVERAQALIGLGEFAAATGERGGDFDYRVTLDGEPVLEGHFQADGVSRADSSLALSDLKLGGVNRLVFARQTGVGRLYYGLNLRYVTPALNVEALNRGIAVSREYSLLDDPDTPVESARLGDIVRVHLTVVAAADRKFVSVEDFLPAGLEALDTTLATTPLDLRLQLEQERRDATETGTGGGFAAPWFHWYWSPWDQSEARDDRFALFATDLPRGVHEYVYYTRAAVPGDFFVAPAHAEESPFPEVFGRSDSGRFRVTE